MDRLTHIVNYINETICDVFGISDGNIHGLCDRVEKDGRDIFFYKGPNLTQIGVSLDDAFKATILHYNESTDLETDYEGGFGANPLTTSSYSNTMLVYLPNANNKRDSRSAIEDAVLAFPFKISNEGRNILGLKKVDILPTEASARKHEIFKEEFRGQKNNLSDESILLKIKYHIDTQGYRNCVVIDCSLDEPMVISRVINCEQQDAELNIFAGDAENPH